MNFSTCIESDYSKHALEVSKWLKLCLFIFPPALALSFIVSAVIDVPMGAFSLFPIVGVWFLSIAIVFFFKGAFDYLAGLLLIDSCLLIFQTGMYFAFGPVFALFEVGPLLLLTFAALVRFREMHSSSAFIFFLWMAVNLPSLLMCLTGVGLSFADGIIIYSINVFFPLAIYSLILRYRMAGGSLGNIQLVVFCAVIIHCIIPTVLIPIELIMRGSNSFANLGVAGRAYSVIGIVLLVWPLLISHAARMNIAPRVFSLIIIFLLFASSFSRGALFCFALIAFITILFRFRQSIVLLKPLGLLFLVLIGGLFVFVPDRFNDFLIFWQVRLNISDSQGGSINFDPDSILNTGRVEIWEMALQLIAENSVFGYGIGATPALVSNITNGLESFSGMHNQFLTVFVERGIVGLTGLVFIYLRIGSLLLMHQKGFIAQFTTLLFFGIYMLFSNATGVELFLNSSRSLNASMTAYVFIMLAFLEPIHCRKEAKQCLTMS